MKRKINRVGANTLTVSLPSQWVKAHNLKPGDEIEVAESLDTLMIGKPQKSRSEEAVVDLPDAKLFLRRIILTPYIKGYDRIRLRFKDKANLPLIHNAVRLLVGFEILELGDNYCILRNIAQGNSENSDNILNRVQLVVKTMFGQFMEYSKTGSESVKEQMFIYDEDINKLTWYLRRLMNQSGVSSNAISSYTFITLYEQIGDYIYYFAKAFEGKPHKQVIAHMESIAEMLDKLYKLFNKPETDKIIAFAHDGKKMVSDITKSAKSMDGLNATYCHYLLGIIFCMQHITEEFGK